ncbi:hypothetical protein E4T39_03417 [Aureobasidium subglaciale]|nr:hypothetical protein E4T39_03417 [Aureobasidium subglaciale]
MATTVRGPATGRFYKFFHAWSRLANPAHQQRRCFVPGTVIAKDGLDTRIRKQHVATPEGLRDRVKTEAIDKGLAVTTILIKQSRLEKYQAHATFLPRLRAELGAFIEPIKEVRDDGHVRVRIFIPVAKQPSLKLLGSIMRHRSDDEDTLTNTTFITGSEDASLRPIKLQIDLPAETADLLEDAGDELLLRIQTTFDIGLTFELPSQKPPKLGMRVLTMTGKRVDVEAARDFIRTMHIDPEEPPGEVTEGCSVKDSKLSSTNSEPPQEPVQLDPEELKSAYRTAMRSVPSSVVILTTRGRRCHFTELRGMTLSSFTSVTLDPEPIVSFSIRRPSSTLDCIISGQPFVVNFPHATIPGAQIADIFAKAHVLPHQPFYTLRQLGLGSARHKAIPAAFIDSKHIKTHFRCQAMPEKSLEIGDHTVVFARVIEVRRDPRLDSSANAPIFLAYAQGKHRKIDVLKNIEVPEWKANEAVEYTPDAPETSTPQSLQQEAKTPGAQVPVGPTASELADREAANKLSDAYWSMALDIDEDEEDAALEQRAADQRNLGEAERPKEAETNRTEDTSEDEPIQKLTGADKAKHTPTWK